LDNYSLIIKLFEQKKMGLNFFIHLKDHF